MKKTHRIENFEKAQKRIAKLNNILNFVVCYLTGTHLSLKVVYFTSHLCYLQKRHHFEKQ